MNTHFLSFDTVLSQDRYALMKLAEKLSKSPQRALSNSHLQRKFEQRYARSQADYQARLAALPTPKFEQDLPILAQKQAIMQAIETHQVVIISGETGSGKTTQLPQLCLALKHGAAGMIAHTQPRRIAAKSIASRIAAELEEPLGKSVGYQVRFDQQTSNQTVIKLMTDGLLLAETLSDPYLSRYQTIIIDEAHERSLNIDFLMGYLKQLLPKRPDLKLIITSATIDTEKFSRHFANAPIIEVSGRSYPVEILYRLPEENQELPEAILSAIEELDSYQRGDILIFHATEREIRETAAYLETANLAHTAILPLYARLSHGEQQRIFNPDVQRRIILSTNVAETSLTVPRIKYVIDTGTARISRYSVRSKTQRLPIEPISQAAANQRAGRCGRLSAGICLRLYSEEDFNLRPTHTDPEILRTNLAAVILQMLVLKLGDITQFPFIDAPDNRQINDGYRLLFELQAVDSKQRLTELGKQMAQLPIDPRYARIIFAAAKNHTLNQAIILIAALSIQDPRERPIEMEAKAEKAHLQFADANSDFQTLLNLYLSYQQQKKSLSKTKLRAWCQKHFLNAQRMREWHELSQQLSRELHAQFPHAPYTPTMRQGLTAGSKGSLSYENDSITQLHSALLTGLLDHIALWQENTKQYQGTRNRALSVHPSSALSKRRAPTIMAAHLLETSKLFARICASVEVSMIEPLAKHLTKTQYHQPRWHKKAGNVMAEQTVTLYGLPIVKGRSMPFAPHDAALAHRIFVQEALVTGEIQTHVKVIAENQRLLEQLSTLEHKTRQSLIEEEAIAEFYFSRLPESVHSRVSLEQWVKKHGEAPLRMQASDFLAQHPSAHHYPETLKLGEHSYRLTYQFDPNSCDDGITLHLPLSALNAIHPADIDGLIPAMLESKIEAHLRALPKLYRRQLQPISDYAHALFNRLQAEPQDAPKQTLAEKLSKHIMKIKGLNIPSNAFDEQALSAHHRMKLRLFDAQGTIVESRELSDLQQRYAQQARHHFQQHIANHSPKPIDNWQWESLPESVQHHAVTAYPAITAEKTGIYLKHYDTPKAAAIAHKQGCRALIMQKIAPKIKHLKKSLPQLSKLNLYYHQINPNQAFADELIAGAIDALCLEQPIRTQQAFNMAIQTVNQQLFPYTNQMVNQLCAVLESYHHISQTLNQCRHKSAKEDIRQQLSLLIYPDFIHHTNITRLSDLERYLKAIALRLTKLHHDPLKDLQRQQLIQTWQNKLNSLLQTTAHQAIAFAPPALVEFFYGLEEYRIQVFAQEIGNKRKISETVLQTLHTKAENSIAQS